MLVADPSRQKCQHQRIPLSANRCAGHTEIGEHRAAGQRSVQPWSNEDRMQRACQLPSRVQQAVLLGTAKTEKLSAQNSGLAISKNLRLVGHQQFRRRRGGASQEVQNTKRELVTCCSKLEVASIATHLAVWSKAPFGCSSTRRCHFHFAHNITHLVTNSK